MQKAVSIWSKEKVRHLRVWCHMEISGPFNSNCTCMLFISHVLGLCWPFSLCAWGSAPLLHCYQILKLFDRIWSSMPSPQVCVGFSVFQPRSIFFSRILEQDLFSFFWGSLEPERNKKASKHQRKWCHWTKGVLFVNFHFKVLVHILLEQFFIFHLYSPMF